MTQWPRDDGADAASNLVVGNIELPPLGLGHAGGSQEQIAVGGGNLWIANQDRTITRIDTQTERIVATINPRDVGAVAVGEGAVWVAGFGTIFRVDPATNTVTAEIDVPKADPGITALVAGAGSVWATSAENGLLWQIDDENLELRRSIDVGRLPGSIAVGAGSVWVGNALDGTVSRIEPVSGRVMATITLGLPVRGVAVVGDRVWVTVG